MLPHETCAACPMSSFGYALAYYPPTRQVLLFGGTDNYNNTWLWNSHGWTLAHPSASPPGRFDAAVAYDPVMQVVLMYGGRLAPGQLVDDTWAWNGKTWTEFAVGTSHPPPDEGGVMAWDQKLAEMVLVVPGPSVKSPQPETWIWTGTRWLRALAGDFPTNISFGPMTYDPVSNSLLAVGFRYETATSSSVVMLRWDGTAWRELSTRHTPPSIVAGLALDPVSDRLLLVCDPTQLQSSEDEVWMWTGVDWQSRGAFSGARQPGGVVDRSAKAAASCYSATRWKRLRDCPSLCTSGRGRDRYGRDRTLGHELTRSRPSAIGGSDVAHASIR